MGIYEIFTRATLVILPKRGFSIFAQQLQALNSVEIKQMLLETVRKTFVISAAQFNTWSCYPKMESLLFFQIY